jgi:hypothetical protein
MPVACSSAINFISVTSSSTADGNAPWTPNANELLFCWVLTYGTGARNVPTLTGCGCTWHALTSVSFTSATFTNLLTLFASMHPTPSSGTLHVDCAGQTQDRIDGFNYTLSGIDTSGVDGAGATVQLATATGTGTTLAATLGAFGSVDNATFAVGSIESSNDSTAGSGFAPRNPFTINVHSTLAEFRADNATVADMSNVFSAAWGIIAVEIKAAGPPPPTLTGGGGTSVYRIARRPWR